VAVVCRLLALIATPLGLSIPFDSDAWWVIATAWSVFAMIGALVQALPLLSSSMGWTEQRGWAVGAVGTAALLLFWLLVALPSVQTNGGFTITIAAAAALAGCLFGPGRRF
jgi:hypothetical protein